VRYNEAHAHLRVAMSLFVRSIGAALACSALGCATPRPRPQPAPGPTAHADHAAPTPSDPSAAVQSLGACERMRSTGEARDAALGVLHLGDASLERAVRRFYTREVLNRGIDDRSLVEHPLVFDEVVTAAGDAVAACVAEWRAADPDGDVPRGTGYFVPHHRYVEVNFEFIDASDGMNAYTVFVDAATLEIVAAFRYSNLQP
jgi:hypothetical protein